MNPNIEKAFHDYEALIAKENKPAAFYNGIYTRYENPVLTRDHIPPFWKFDLNEETNPLGLERLGVNAVMNSGAIKLNGQYCLVARVEGNDRKSFFAVARSNNPVQGFRFDDYPVILPDTSPEETNVYDMRLTQHEDGYIYGVFCSESKDKTVNDLSAAFAAAGIVRTKDLVNWERLPDLKTKSPQQRNCVLHPEFVNGKYAFYTRPQDSFIEAGDQGGVSFGLCDDITNAVIDEEKVVSPRRYHTITESKNGAGAVPIKTEKGWIHLAHGVRNTAAGLRSSSQNRAASSSPRWAKSASAMFPMSCSRTVPSLMTTARSTSTTLPPIHACTSRRRALHNCSTMRSAPRPTRCVPQTASASAVPSSRKISNI